MHLFLKGMIFIGGLASTFTIIPVYNKTVQSIINEEDYQFFPLLIFWFCSLTLFLLWLFATLIIEVAESRMVVEKVLQGIIFGGMIFNLFYILILGWRNNIKYRNKEME